MADTRSKAVPTHFTQEEAASIIREASAHALASREKEKTLSREELVAMAREMGVSEAAVEVALLSRVQTSEDQRHHRKALLGLMTHGMSYTIVLGGLTLVDLFSGPTWWVHWPALAWGVGLAFHAMSTMLGMARRELLKEDTPKSRRGP